MINPIGVPNLQLVKGYIDEVLAAWAKLDIAHKIREKWPEIISFLMKSCDYLIRMVEMINISGADKKATVIAALSEIYDIVIAQSLPVYLKPFNSKIKDFVFGVILNAAIDYIVSKYNKGNWLPAQPPPAGTGVQ